MSYFTQKIVFIPKREIVTYDYVAESNDLQTKRAEALSSIYKGEAEVVITTIEAIQQRIIPKELLFNEILNFKVGKSYNIETIKKSLLSLGYARCELIEAKGQFSIRGGIIDVGITEKEGVRIELWGDEVDSIRYFNISNQRSTKMIEEIEIYPAHEFILEKNIEDVCKDIERRFKDLENKDNINADIELIKSSNYISKIDKYYDSFYTKTTNLLDYLEDYHIFLDEARKIKARASNVLIDNQNVQKVLIEKGKIIPDGLKDLYEYDEILAKILKGKTIYLEKQDIGMLEESEELKQKAINFETREVNFYKSSMELFLEEAKAVCQKQKKVVVLAGSEETAKKLSLLLLENEIPHKYVEKLDLEIPNSTVIVSTKGLSTGVEIFDLNLLVISSEELFSKDAKKENEQIVNLQEQKK